MLQYEDDLDGLLSLLAKGRSVAVPHYKCLQVEAFSAANMLVRLRIYSLSLLQLLAFQELLLSGF